LNRIIVLPPGEYSMTLRGGSRKKYFGGSGPSSFGRQQRAELLCPNVQY